MVKALMSVLSLLFVVNAHAAPSVIDAVVDAQTSIIQQTNFAGLDWKVGDSATYDLTMAIVIRGTMVMSVASIGEEGIWMNEDIDMGHGIKQQMQILIDPSNGVTKKVVVLGREQQLPSADIEVVDTIEEQITVPAGTFDSMHITARNKAATKNNEINIWLNPQVVPVGGTLKQITHTQLGKMTTALRSFVKN